MRSVNDVGLFDLMPKVFIGELNPAAKQLLWSTPVRFAPMPTKGWATPNMVRLGPGWNADVAAHEASHVLSYNTPGMESGTFPDGAVDPYLDLRMAVEYSGGDQERMNRYGTGGEAYPMALQMAGWNPRKMPDRMKPYYDPWFTTGWH